MPLVPRSGSLSRFGLALLLAGCRPAARVGDEAVSEALPSAPVVV